MLSRDKEKKELIAKVMHRESGAGPQQSGKKENNNNLWMTRFIGVMIAVFIFITIGVNIYYYNLFVNLEQEVTDARANIEATLQLRENMIPAILNTINEFVSHENEIFVHSADVRAKSLQNQPRPPESNNDPSSLPVPVNDWDKLLSELFAVAENYPDLKTGESFVLLMSKIADAETEIQQKRVEYNTKVRTYNIRISTFPATLASSMFRRKAEKYFQWQGKPEWVTTLDEERRKRTDEILEKWRSKLIEE